MFMDKQKKNSKLCRREKKSILNIRCGDVDKKLSHTDIPALLKTSVTALKCALYM